MKKLIWGIIYVIACIQLVGCKGWVVRTASSTKPRLDQEVAGNRGFLSGKPAAPPKEPAFKERKVYRIEVEVPEMPKKRKPATAKKKSTIHPPKEDKAIWGNKGYIFGAAAKKTTKQKQAQETPMETVKETISQVFRAVTGAPRTYRARKDDTLQKISNKFYGTTRKWVLIYNANKDKLKGPDKIRPGQVLIIPELEEAKK